jgi:hypothetical protein
VSVAKAGIITTLNARTSILAAANPVGSKYDTEKPITFNIDLPPTLISRFDLLYLVLDTVDESVDRRLAQHLVGLYLEDAPETAGQDVIVCFLSAIEYNKCLILFSRLTCCPHISPMRALASTRRSQRKLATNSSAAMSSSVGRAMTHAPRRSASPQPPVNWRVSSGSPRRTPACVSRPWSSSRT